MIKPYFNESERLMIKLNTTTGCILMLKLRIKQFIKYSLNK